MKIRTNAFHVLAGVLVVIGALSATPRTPSADAIIAGERAKKTKAYSASFQRIESPRNDLHVCGATLVAPQWAITAGHCTNWVDGKDNTAGTGDVRAALSGNPDGWRIRLGSLDTRSGGRQVAVEQFARRSRSLSAGSDLTLLKLVRPVRVKPARLATEHPKPGTPATILGWGYTGAGGGWGNYKSFVSYPRMQQQAKTQVWPGRTCGLNRRDPGLCVGGAEGRPNPENMDSGGPVFVEQPGRGTVLAGTVNGGNFTGRPGPALYTDISKHRSWIRSYTSGRKSIPEPRSVKGEGLAGTAIINGCSASVMDTGSSQPTDRALLLTNGHCAHRRPPQGKAFSPRPDKNIVTINGAAGNAITRTSTTHLLYATMTGTDVAVYRLADTYSELSESGVRVLRLSESGPEVGDSMSLLSGNLQTTFSCEVSAIVPTLRETGYKLNNAIRYGRSESCRPESGTSGSPLVDSETGEIVAIHNTHNYGDGRPCSEGNPCEVDSAGKVTAVKRRGYAQQTSGLVNCLVSGSRIDLAGPGCLLTKDLVR